jgi:hypothetical protein
MIGYLFRLLKCRLVTDGGGALILVSAERAPATSRKNQSTCSAPARVSRRRWSAHRSFLRKQESRAPRVPAVALDPRFRGGDESNTSSRAFRVAGPKAFAEVASRTATSII